jgi:DNA mismatch repair protein MutS2
VQLHTQILITQITKIITPTSAIAINFITLQKNIKLVYPDNFENRIGFDTVRDLIKSKCLGESAKMLADEIKFCTDAEFIRRQLDEVDEMVSICLLKDNYPAGSYPSIEVTAKKLKVEGTCLQLFEVVNIRTVLENLKSLKAFFKTDEKEEYPLLKNRISQVVFPTYLLDRINNIVSKNGTIKDNASPELRNIRKILLDRQNSVTKKLNSILNIIRENGWVGKDLSATMVNGRLVLPIEANHKRKIKGLIHDVSASGKTSYIEPQEIVEINNDIRELELAENREIQKILLELTQEIRPYWENLYDISNIIAEFDLLRAKALFSISIEAIKPSIDENSGLDIVRGKHPLLYLTFKKEKKEVVPASIKLDAENRILLISGPNAGGKSVSLKTTALLSYMVQCGLPVPVGGSTVMGVFNNIFIDIGDQQSIENDLSTYSSHLLNMKYFLKNANNKTLVLIDEFGSGTDPLIGGTIAEAILEELNNNNKVFGVITTHYSNLKVFASNAPGIINGAMHINSNTMQPTFILETGIPGSSYALEIAQRIGLPQSVIEKTIAKSGSDQINFDKFLRKVMNDKRYWERKRQQIRMQEKKIEEILEKNLIELETIKSKKKQIIDTAKKASEQMLSEVNKQIENAIRKIKESQADKETTKQARQEIQTFKENFEKSNSEGNDEIVKKYNHIKKKIEDNKARKSEKVKKLEFVKIDENKINIGSKVRIKGQQVVGEVTDMNDKNAVVSFGNMYTSIAKERLEKVSENEYKQQNRSASTLHFNYNEKVMSFKPYVDVRGNRVEEAVKKIADLIDEAIMLNFKEVKILHGKGNGILRRYIRDYLRKISQVETCLDEDVRFGGDGITIVKLK